MKKLIILSVVSLGLLSCKSEIESESKSELTDNLILKLEAVERKVDSLELQVDSQKSDETDTTKAPAKIRKSVGSSSPYQFNGKNQWSQLADLKSTIEVTEKSSFIVTYSVASWRNCRIENSYVCTRLLVDGREIMSYRQCGEGDYPSTSSTGVVELEPGSHSVNVQYKSPMSCSTNDNNPSYGSKFMGRNLTLQEL